MLAHLTPNVPKNHSSRDHGIFGVSPLNPIPIPSRVKKERYSKKKLALKATGNKGSKKDPAAYQWTTAVPQIVFTLT